MTISFNAYRREDRGLRHIPFDFQLSIQNGLDVLETLGIEDSHGVWPIECFEAVLKVARRNPQASYIEERLTQLAAHVGDARQAGGSHITWA